MKDVKDVKQEAKVDHDFSGVCSLNLNKLKQLRFVTMETCGNNILAKKFPH